MSIPNIIPFHKPYITDDEINEVVDSVKSGWWTIGPKTKKFEAEFNDYIGSNYSVSANSWTAAAHLALEAINLQEGDEVIVPAITFTATAEIICYFKAKPVIVDVQKDSFNISPVEIEKAITKKTKAIIPVHYAGLPCDMDEITDIANNYNLKIIEDAAHSLPATYKQKKIGTLSEITCFSFYATKTLATGEGGMLCTSNEEIANRASIMRMHGMNRDAWNRYTSQGSWYYEVIAPGYKYNFTDLQAALGLAQLKKVDLLYEMRKTISDLYDTAFNDNEYLITPHKQEDRESAIHLYPLRLNLNKIKINRGQFIEEMKNRGIVCSVHFIPLYRHPFYRDTFSLCHSDFPVSEKIYAEQVSLPIWPGMTDLQINYIIENVLDIIKLNAK
ncbi:MAG: DegT/DnrJ/EryC1/StrS family aminotransferase [Ignavibacteriaceae bacterium]|nr:DegT/DnrJ/EryC1/StrS family aminotransferase [Ignavibacteriaceae bacterium]HRI48115.1 DegT/DnrJ/EryC1/StrS family aminotransferase [Ignavibacteriaceae bacterium]